MADTSIEWSDMVWNPVVGCTRASLGCDNCYAVKMSHRLENMGQAKYAGLTSVNQRGDRHFNGVVRCVEEDLLLPLKWKKPRRCFVNSMSDLFHKDVPFEFIDKVFAVMALCPQHTFQILTKRPERMAEYLREGAMPGRIARAVLNIEPCAAAGKTWQSLYSQQCNIARWLDAEGSPDTARWLGPWPLPNVWLGTSCEGQKAADERIPHLLKCPAAVRFLSCEPLIGDIDLGRFLFADCDRCEGLGGYYPNDPQDDEDCRDCGGSGYDEDQPLEELHWVIVGGESGPGARPCVLDWIKSIADQCSMSQVPCFVKQLGAVPAMRLADWHALRPTPLLSCQKRNRVDEDKYVVLAMQSAKGGEVDEWPTALRVRQFPEGL